MPAPRPTEQETSNMAKTMLKVTGLKVAYGGIQAVKGVTFTAWIPP